MLYYKGCGKELIRPTEEQLKQYETDYIAEPKLDGQWLQVQSDPNGNITTYSRTGKIKNIPGITHTRIWPNTILVGETSYGSQWLQDKYGILFFPFDIIKWGVINYTEEMLLSRKFGLKRFVEVTYHSKFFNLIDYKENFYQAYQREHEGIVLKHKHGKYVIGKQDDWIKVKKVFTEDGIIVGINVSEAKTIKGLAKSVMVNVNGAITEIGNMTLDMRKYLTKYKPLNQVVEFQHFGKFESGSFRHPSLLRIRSDL